MRMQHIGWLVCLITMAGNTVFAGDPPPRQAVIMAVGQAGRPEYGERFAAWAQRWRQVAEGAGYDFHSVGTSQPDATSDRSRLETILQSVPAASTEPLWLVLIGHGTFDGEFAKFNLRGPDVSASELAPWLARFSRPVVVINCASSSGPFINRLSGPDRVIVTATRSGFEHNLTRFGDHFSRAITDLQADLDKDQQVSLLEAYLFASARVAASYRDQDQLATEHALLDDNGDSRGTPADWFRSVIATRTAKDGAELDGLRAHQIHLVLSAADQALSPEVRENRDALERDLAALRDRRDSMESAEYFDALEVLLLQLARLPRGE